MQYEKLVLHPLHERVVFKYLRTWAFTGEDYMSNWHFGKHSKDQRVRDPIQGEFFATDVIATPVEALVREGIQNSLDAPLGDGPVFVRIYVSGEDNALPAARLSKFLDGNWEHTRAPGNGLRPERVPNDSEPCPFLVFEDFGTTGLCGDETQWEPIEGKKNQFFHFFRAEGLSDKSEQDRGRWGVGKHVFFGASRINTTFGFTTRSCDGRTLLMGQTILKTHRIEGSDLTYNPDGWFGRKSTADDLVMPFSNEEDGDLLREFCESFDIQRKQNEPGLSVVIPWCELEYTKSALIEAVIKDYFYPILAAKLQVWIEAPDLKTILDGDSLDCELEQCTADFRDQFKPLLNLVRWAQATSPDQRISLLSPPVSGAPPEWSESLFPEGAIDHVRERLRNGECAALRVPVVVRPKGGGASPTHFDVYLVQDPSEKLGHPRFVRNGIVISDVRCPLSRGVGALVVIEDNALAAFVGDSENPAHTQWQDANSHFKGKYTYGQQWLKFIRTSVFNIVRFLKEDKTVIDPAALAHIFSVPTSNADKAVSSMTPRPKLANGTNPPPPPPPIPNRTRPIRIEETANGGFAIRQGDRSLKIPRFIEVLTAYYVRKGNPFKHYDPDDFDMGSNITTSARGAEIVEASGNRTLIRVENEDFEVSFSGFDTRRDLRVRAVERGGDDANTTA